MIIPYHPDLRIVNLEQLPKGSRARFLEVLEDDPVLIAVRWRHRLPKQLPDHRHLVEFRR